MLSSKAVIQRIATRTGYPVTSAWAVRNHGTMGTVAGVVRHHTGTGINYARLDDYPTLRVVREGRSDLPGPLCTWGIGRSGRIYLVNDQVAWHAGNGWWQGVTDANGHMWGIEAESDGTYWTAAETDAYHRLVASALYELGRGWEWAPRHAQWALPHGRKTDSAGMDEALFERRVRAMLANPASINRNGGGKTPAAPTGPTTQEDDVSAQDVWSHPIPNPASKLVMTAEARLLDVEIGVGRLTALVIGDESTDQRDQNTLVGKLDGTGGRLARVEQIVEALAVKQGVEIPPPYTPGA